MHDVVDRPVRPDDAIDDEARPGGHGADVPAHTRRR